MTPEQWTTILSQLGVGGVAILVIVKVIVPMFIEKARELVTAHQHHADTVDRQAESLAAALDRNTEAVSGLAQRVARLEALLEHDEPRRVAGR